MVGVEIFVSEQASVKDHGNYQHASFGPSFRLAFAFGGAEQNP